MNYLIPRFEFAILDGLTFIALITIIVWFLLRDYLKANRSKLVKDADIKLISTDKNELGLGMILYAVFYVFVMYSNPLILYISVLYTIVYWYWFKRYSSTIIDFSVSQNVLYVNKWYSMKKYDLRDVWIVEMNEVTEVLKIRLKTDEIIWIHLHHYKEEPIKKLVLAMEQASDDIEWSVNVQKRYDLDVKQT